MDQQPTIELTGVRLRPLRADDAVAWHACLSDPQVTERFTREGCLRSYRVCRGVPRDFSVFSILRSEWEASPQAE